MRRWSVLVPTMVIALAGCGTHATTPSTAPSTEPTRIAVVPWRALPATRPVIPSTRIPPRPDPVYAERGRRCRGTDVVFQWKRAGAAAGTMVQNVDVDLAPGHAPCAVFGRPSAVAHTVEGTAIPGRLQMFTVRSHAPVLLTRDQHALVQLTWPSACFSESSGDASFTLGTPAGPGPSVCVTFRTPATSDRPTVRCGPLGCPGSSRSTSGPPGGPRRTTPCTHAGLRKWPPGLTARSTSW